MFQSKIGRQGDFELLVPIGDEIAHLYRDNDSGMVWKRRATLERASTGAHGGVMASTPVAAVAAYQSMDGVAGSPNLEAIVRRHSAVLGVGGDTFEAWWFDPAAGVWNSAGAVEVGGSALQAPFLSFSL